MIKYTSGNLLASDAQCLVNTVNCVGVMGKGIALQFKNKFPKNYDYYRQYYEQLSPGKLLIFKEDNKVIINFPTKIHWKNPSKYEYIVDGLKKLRQFLQEKEIQSIAIPALGCSNGKLEWTKVKPLIEEHLSDLNTIIYVYEPR